MTFYFSTSFYSFKNRLCYSIASRIPLARFLWQRPITWPKQRNNEMPRSQCLSVTAQTTKQTNEQTKKDQNKQTNKQTDKHTRKQTSKQTDKCPDFITSENAILGNTAFHREERLPFVVCCIRWPSGNHSIV